MSFKFFSDRIKTSSISLDEAVKKAQAAKPTEVPSLDDLLNRLDAENKGIKTASSQKETKTASVEETVKDEATKVEVKVSDELQKTTQKAETSSKEVKEAGEPFGGKQAPPFGSEDKDEDKDEDKKDDKKDDKDSDDKDSDDKKEEKEDNKASSKKTRLKIAKTIDFRNWEAEDVIKGWEQHGSIKACLANVKDKTSNPKLYCGLLQTASGMAKTKLSKTASAKEANKPTKAIWKKLAKLTDKERSMLDKYWRKLYGDYYVDAMLSDY